MRTPKNTTAPKGAAPEAPTNETPTAAETLLDEATTAEEAPETKEQGDTALSEEAPPTAAAAVETTQKVDPVDDLPDWLYCEDADGNRLTDEEVEAAMAPRTIRFTFGSRVYKIEVWAGNVGIPIISAIRRAGINLILEAGYKPGDDIEDESDPRQARMAELSEDWPEMEAAYIALAIAATTRDEEGKAKTSVPQLRDELTAERLRSLGSLGNAYAGAVQQWWNETQ